jgi:c-di-GMP-binding flagellar brake protein YcgR
MSAGKQEVERRRDGRFQVPDGVFVEVRRPSHSKLGEIINISMGGVAFRYLATKKPSNGSYKLDIFFDEGRFRLNDIFLQTVTDFKTHKIPYTSITMRRSSVQFKRLSHHQSSQLEHFIENYAVGEA